MKVYRNTGAFVQGAINTLAQVRTEGTEKPATIIQGQGSQPMTKESCQIRGKRKQITQALAINLMLIAKQKGNKDLVKRFRNTYYCQNRIVTHNGKIFSKYCKNRFCTVCSSNRKAQLINDLRPIIGSWESPYFVTLTVANCKAQYLKRKIRKMYAVLKTITERHYKRYQRGKGIKLIGIRNLECTFNPQRMDYHPHLHLIVPDKQTANTLMQDWLKEWGVFEASGSSQHKRPVKDLEHDLVETIKYCAKIFTEPDPKAKDKKTAKRNIYVRAIYNIIDAMNGVRLYESFGFTVPQKEKQHKQALLTVDYQDWYYVPAFKDWLDTETGHPLLGYEPLDELVKLLDGNIDIEKE